MEESEEMLYIELSIQNFFQLEPENKLGIEMVNKIIDFIEKGSPKIKIIARCM